MIKSTAIILLFVHLTLCIKHGQDEEKPQEFLYENPCFNDFVLVTKPDGPITKETNYWIGTIDLSSFQYLKSLKVILKVSQPAKVEIDQSTGRIAGAKTGKAFRLFYNGTPKNVTDISFKIIGTHGLLFPNITQLLLSNRDICKKPITVSIIL